MRRTVPVFVCGDAIVWVGGDRLSEQVKITPETTTILKAEILTPA